ncbi:LysM peptidoglycan-binding domain-containing protein [Oerskovia sp. Sa1BUA8]|uniref:LysM peptidoglycan-binding domain-containing protein n=1 Tax=Oerskovia douganii TaxID=2762210 RepID=A0A9D5YYI0_9CELL|nr:LysM peptidoglycan-binding domain-containing protein [Oerskovia douganii]MBE7698919.1 LysM peptidoglycan-binding domain-containing protein [Oerskovia douganii]
MFDEQVFEPTGEGGSGTADRGAAMSVSAMEMTQGWGVERRAARQQEAPLRLTARGRAVLVLLVAAVLALGALWGGRAVASGPGEPVEVRVHVVEAGETLWQHASALAAGGRDVRDVMVDLAELNNLSSNGLQVGQRLLLPVDPDFGR